MKFSEKLKLCRKDLKITQAKLADMVGVDVRTIRNYEAGRSYPKNRKVYLKLAKIFSKTENFFSSETVLADFPYDDDSSFDQQQIVTEVLSISREFFKNKKVSEVDKKAVFEAVQIAYFENHFNT